MTALLETTQTGIVAPAPAKHGATEGPLKDLIPIYIDVETFMDTSRGISLRTMTLLNYISASHLTSISIAIGDAEPIAILTPNGQFAEEDQWIIPTLQALAESESYVFVAHNAAFDIRVLRYMLGLPQPYYVWCTMEGAMAAWPELPGGYKLQTLGITLDFKEEFRKIEGIDLEGGKHSAEELKAYNIRDVVAARELYLRQIARLDAREQRVGLLTHNARKNVFMIDSAKLKSLITTLDKNSRTAELEARRVMSGDDEDSNYFSVQRDELADDGSIVREDEKSLTDEDSSAIIEFDPILTSEDAREIFNREGDGTLKSIRRERLQRILQKKFGVHIPSTSLKKLSPVWQAQHPKIMEILRQTTRANKMLSHGKKSTVFIGAECVPLELGYFRAHTGRWSSPSPGRGKGLNLHNIPKNDHAIAKPIRSVFKIPDDKCLVRGDLANVEYRVLGWLTNSKTICSMFDPALGGNLMTDPYVQAWKSMTNVSIDKKSPIRQVSKSAVLGLSFLMSAGGYAKVLLTVCSDPISKVTEATLTQMIGDLGWQEPPPGALKGIIERTGCSTTIATASYNIWQRFNQAHPEFRMTADWLYRCVQEVATVGDREESGKDKFAMAQERLDRMMEGSAAPDPNKIRLTIDDDRRALLPSIRVQCGPWAPTVCWRYPFLRYERMNGGNIPRLSIMKATMETKGVTVQLLTENVTQAAARNGLAYGLLELESKYGRRDILHIHDEVMLIVDKNRDAVLKAREDLLSVFGPASNHPLSWALLIKPNEVSVTQSMWEEESDIAIPALNPKTGLIEGGDRWGKIERNDPAMFLNLP